MKRNPQPRTRLDAPIIVLALCGLYLLFSVGIMKATHFCMGKEASVAYFTAESKDWACSIPPGEGNHCCHDKQELVKLEDSQKTLSNLQLSSPTLTLLGALYNVSRGWHAPLAIHFSAYAERAQPPPTVLFRLHCSFVFYDERVA
jgi:hypothetical protein